MAILVTIAGVDRTARVRMETLRVQAILTSQVDTCTFSLRVPESAKAELPVSRDEVIVTVGGVREFAGIVVQNPRGFVGLTGELEVQVTCQDYQALLERKLVAQTYIDEYAGAIVQDLIAQLPAGFGITAGSIVQGPLVRSWAVNYETVGAAVERLAKATGLDWFVDYAKALQFIDPAAAARAAPWDLTEGSSPPYARSAPFEQLVFQEDVTQVRNVVTVRGAKTRSNLVAQQEKADGVARIFHFRGGEVVKGTLTMTIAGIAQDVGEEGVADPATTDWLVNYKNRSVQTSKAGTPTPAAGATVQLEYAYDQQIIVTARDEQSIARYGEWEHVIVEESIRDRATANQVAKADLRSYGNPAVTLTYNTTRPGLRAGMTQVVSVPRQDVSGTFLLKAVGWNVRGRVAQATAYQPAGYLREWTVQAEKVS